jgi:hypothetical protein
VPRLNAAQRRHLAAQRDTVDVLAAAGCHVIEWLDTFSSVTASGSPCRMQDGWCRRGGRSHLRAVISATDDIIIWRFGQPTDRCPG